MVQKALRKVARLTWEGLRLTAEIPWLSSVYLKYRPYTMVPVDTYVKKLLVAHSCRNISGCVIECGVWRGGVIAGMVETLGSQRYYYAFDSFEGLPPAKEVDGHLALEWQAKQTDKQSPLYLDNCRADVIYVEEALKKAHCSHYELIKGWFDETLPSFKPIDKIAVLHLDGDWFDSIMTCLEHLYQYMAPGGVIIIDDYYLFDGCSRAVHSFLAKNNLPIRITEEYGEICTIRIPRHDYSLEQMTATFTS